MAEYAISAWPTSRGNDLCRIADRAHFRGGAATDAQRPALDELRAASAKAIDMLKAGCPNELPSIPWPMKRATFTEQQIAFALQQAESGTQIAEVCRKVGISEATFYHWKQLSAPHRRATYFS
jgi:hypothetical protein